MMTAFMTTNLKISTALAITSLCLAGPAFGQISITTAYGNGADTELVNDTGPGSGNLYGSSATMEQRNYDATRQRIAYLRFDLSGVNTSVSGWAAGATLTFDVVTDNRNRTWSLFGVSDSAGNNNWDESTLNYNSASGFSSAAAGYYTLNTSDLYNGNTPTTLEANSSGYALGSINVTGAGIFTTTATAGAGSATTVNLESFLNTDTDGLVTLFFLKGTDSAMDAYIATKENTTTGVVFPTLNLPNATAVPEPSTLAMLGLGGLLGFCGLRRRNV
jgi:hypothetical protein